MATRSWHQRAARAVVGCRPSDGSPTRRTAVTLAGGLLVGSGGIGFGLRWYVANASMMPFVAASIAFVVIVAGFIHCWAVVLATADLNTEHRKAVTLATKPAAQATAKVAG